MRVSLIQPLTSLIKFNYKKIKNKNTCEISKIGKGILVIMRVLTGTHKQSIRDSKNEKDPKENNHQYSISFLSLVVIHGVFKQPHPFSPPCLSSCFLVHSQSSSSPDQPNTFHNQYSFCSSGVRRLHSRPWKQQLRTDNFQEQFPAVRERFYHPNTHWKVLQWPAQH